MSSRERALLAAMLGLLAVCLSAVHGIIALGAWTSLRAAEEGLADRAALLLEQAYPEAGGAAATWEGSDFRDAFRQGGVELLDYSFRGSGEEQGCDFSFRGNAEAVLATLGSYDARALSIPLSSLFLAAREGGILEGRAGAFGARRISASTELPLGPLSAALARPVSGPRVKRDAVQPSPEALTAPIAPAYRGPETLSLVGSFSLPGGALSYALKDGRGGILFLDALPAASAVDGEGRTWTFLSHTDETLSLSIEGIRHEVPIR